MGDSKLSPSGAMLKFNKFRVNGIVPNRAVLCKIRHPLKLFSLFPEFLHEAISVEAC